jgi:hypothetical protein
VGLVRSDVRALPFRERAFDLVLCMRFLYYFDRAERVLLIREMTGLSRKWLVLQVRLRSTVPAFLWKLRHRMGMTARDRSRRCLTVTEARREVEEASGFRVVRVRPVSLWFSDRAYVLCARAAGSCL